MRRASKIPNSPVSCGRGARRRPSSAKPGPTAFLLTSILPGSRLAHRVEEQHLLACQLPIAWKVNSAIFHGRQEELITHRLPSAAVTAPGQENRRNIFARTRRGGRGVLLAHPDQRPVLGHFAEVGRRKKAALHAILDGLQVQTGDGHIEGARMPSPKRDQMMYCRMAGSIPQHLRARLSEAIEQGGGSWAARSHRRQEPGTADRLPQKSVRT